MKLQDRFLYKELLRNFSLTLLSLALLFFVIDYALQAKVLADEPFSLFISYYIAKLSSFASILLPFAFLLAALLILADLSSKRQWIALQACRISRLAILRPFFLFAGLITLLLLLNNQYLSHLSLNHPQKPKKSTFFDGSSKVHAHRLKAGGFLFFQSYERSKEQLHDIYWLAPDDTLWHMESLDIAKLPAVASHVKKLVRDEKKRYFLQASYEEIVLEDFSLELPEAHDELLDAKEQPLSLLAKKMHLFPQDDQEARIASCFLYKLLTPFLPLLLLFAVAPTTLAYRKNISYFAIFAVWIAFYIIVIALLDAAFFLGESQMINPSLAICLPLILVVAVGGISWSRAT